MLQVMGERRITIPLYTAAGVTNLVNAITLLAEPSLKNAFLAWGSVNVRRGCLPPPLRVGIA